MREREDLLRAMFRNLEQRDLESVVKYFREKTIDICINYPDKDIVLPWIVILLGTETESDPVLGDLQQNAEDFRRMGQAPFPKEELLGSQTVIGSGSVGNVSGPAGSGKLLLEPTTAVGGTLNTITAPSSTTLLIDPYEENEVFVVTMEGTGAGQRRSVVGITPSLSGGPVIIEVSQNWATTPDATTVFKLVSAPDFPGGTGEPSQLFVPSDNVERLGQIYQAQYRLDVVAHPQELTIYIYSIMKAILTVSRFNMAKQGLLTMSMGGTDLGPVPEMYPTIAYRRAMNLSFRYAFDVIQPIEKEIANQIRIALSVHDPGVKDFDDVERVVTDTSFIVS